MAAPLDDLAVRPDAHRVGARELVAETQVRRVAESAFAAQAEPNPRRACLGIRDLLQHKSFDVELNRLGGPSANQK